MRLKWIFTAGALAGVVLAARRKNQRALTDHDRWSRATDPVTPTTD